MRGQLRAAPLPGLSTKLVSAEINYEFGQEKQLSFEKSDGGTKSKVGRLISQFQEFAKA